MSGAPHGGRVEGFRAGRYALRELGLFPTWHCDIACRHCLFASSPKVRGQLPRAVATRAIRAAARWTTATRVVVSGGEPFSDLPYLIDLAHATRGARLGFRIVTNGSFATDPARARESLAALAAAGLETLTLSWDGFHEEFLPAARVRNALAACRALGIPALLSVVVTRTQTLAHALAPLGDDAFDVPLVQFRCLPVGRAARQVAADDLLPTPPQDVRRPCRADFGSLAVTYDGAVYPCGAVGGFTPGIRLGNLHDTSLPRLLRRRDQDLQWVALAQRGPTAFTDLATDAERQALGLAAGEHDCVACQRVFGSALGTTLVQRLRGRLHREVEQRFPMALDLS